MLITKIRLDSCCFTVFDPHSPTQDLWTMSEHINVKVLTLNCWGIPGNIPTISSPVRKERFQAIADFLSVQDYDFVFLQVFTKQTTIQRHDNKQF